MICKPPVYLAALSALPKAGTKARAMKAAPMAAFKVRVMSASSGTAFQEVRALART